MSDPDPRSRARALFLSEANAYGCAEATLITLQEHYALPDAGDSSAAMALNGGIGYSGGMCGAITGAAIAVGRLAGRGIADHALAKAESRRLVQDVMAGFAQEFGSVDCRALTGYDFLEPDQHHAFIESGIWREACMRQIEFAVERARHLVEEATWARPGAPALGPGEASD
jgi:C_GCAxxG_C_C family probable redox protein